jgi:hypothetical protein
MATGTKTHGMADAATLSLTVWLTQTQFVLTPKTTDKDKFTRRVPGTFAVCRGRGSMGVESPAKPGGG